MKFSAVILAGGQSSRMGRDKVWLPRNGKTLLECQIDLVRTLGPSQVFISGRRETDYGHLGLPVLNDRVPNSGPLGGIERALEATDYPPLLVLAADMANMTAEMLRSLLARCSRNNGVIPRVNDRVEPLAAIYPRSSWLHAMAVLKHGSGSATEFANLCAASGNADFYEVTPGESPCFKSWNTPEDIRPNLTPQLT